MKFIASPVLLVPFGILFRSTVTHLRQISNSLVCRLLRSWISRRLSSSGALSSLLASLPLFHGALTCFSFLTAFSRPFIAVASLLIWPTNSFLQYSSTNASFTSVPRLFVANSANTPKIRPCFELMNKIGGM